MTTTGGRGLERHLREPRRELAVLAAGPCCEAASSVVGSAEGGCPCSAPAVLRD